MRSATWLEVDHRIGADSNRAHLTTATRRLHRHAFDQRRVRIEFLVGDRTHHHRVLRCDQVRDARGQRLLVQRVGHVEVQPGIVRCDRAAIDQLRYQMTKQMRRCVKPHHAVAPGPVNTRRDSVANGEGSIAMALLI